MAVASSPGERKALLFIAGGTRLALRLSQVREILAVAPGDGDVEVRGASMPALPVAVALGLPGGPTRFAIVTEAAPPVALKVEAVQGIVDLSSAEVFQLPARTRLPQPSPFVGALVYGGEVALELAVASLGWAPIEPATELPAPPPDLELPTGRELLFNRFGRTYSVPLQLLARVLEAPRVVPVPLTPAAHRGILYHGRAIHPVFDIGALYGGGGGRPVDAADDSAATALLVDAGGYAIAVLADRVLSAAEPTPGEVARPSWDLLFAPA